MGAVWRSGRGRRVVLGLAATAVAAASLGVGAAVAYADKPADDSNCSFAKGISTCTETTSTSEDQWMACLAWDPFYGPVPGTEPVRVTTTYETTATYRGRNTSREPLTSETVATGVDYQVVGPCVPLVVGMP